MGHLVDCGHVSINLILISREMLSGFFHKKFFMNSRLSHGLKLIFILIL